MGVAKEARPGMTARTFLQMWTHSAGLWRDSGALRYLTLAVVSVLHQGESVKACLHKVTVSSPLTSSLSLLLRSSPLLIIDLRICIFSASFSSSSLCKEFLLICSVVLPVRAASFGPAQGSPSRFPAPLCDGPRYMACGDAVVCWLIPTSCTKCKLIET